MAIGSDPEIGARFGTIHGFNWKQWRITVGDDLIGGYAVVIYPDRHEEEAEASTDT